VSIAELARSDFTYDERDTTMRKKSPSARGKKPPAPMQIGDRVVSEAGMPGTVLKLHFGRLGEGAENVWIARVQWHGKHPSISSRYVAKRLRVI
jgi:hypothetical protein